MTIDVIVPAYKPGEKFIELLNKLCEQSVAINRVIVMNTVDNESDVYCPDSKLKECLNIDVYPVKRLEFDHGGTRHEGMLHSAADICVLMTQDAIPYDNELIANLIEPLQDDMVAVSYARQLAYENSSVEEKLTREFNYPEESRIKDIEDVDELQIKAFFCSNVCCAYRRSIYLENDGFEKKTIFNEDMLYAAKIEKAGYKVAYSAMAKVYHSHEYTGKQQFKRNFDNGVSHALHPEVFEGITQEGEGLRMVKTVLRRMLSHGKLGEACKYIFRTGCKFIGFKLGCRYSRLPRRIVLACTSNRAFFEK